MLVHLKALFAPAERGAPSGPPEDRKRLAAAALLVEAARLDGTFDAAEQTAIRAILGRHFGLDGAAADELMRLGAEAQSRSNQLVYFTRAIKDAYGPEDRVALIEMLWEVAYADGELHPYEANLLRRIGGLIYVSDKDRGAARKRVLERLGLKADKAGLGAG